MVILRTPPSSGRYAAVQAALRRHSAQDKDSPLEFSLAAGGAIDQTDEAATKPEAISPAKNVISKDPSRIGSETRSANKTIHSAARAPNPMQ